MSGEDSTPFDAVSESDPTTVDLIQGVFVDWVYAPLRVVWDDYRGRTGLIMVLIYLFAGVAITQVWPQPSPYQAPALVQPMEQLRYPFGTDNLGQDLFGLMVHATPAMFKMIIAGVVVGNTLGIVAGLVSGYVGGNVDRAIMTATDVLISIPGLPLLLLLSAILEPRNPYLVGVILSINAWPAQARGLRSQVLPLRDEEYVESSRSMGLSTSNILIKDILPNLAPLIAIGALGGATSVITQSVGLYFLGILPFTNLNWGVVLNQAYETSGALYSLEAAHSLLVPLLTITGLTFAFTMLAQSLDQVFNPRVRARHLQDAAETEIEEDADDTTTTSEMIRT
jgi:peptide/nickel transport system permease protein